MVLIGGTKWAVIKAQELTRDQIQHDLPHYSDKEVWRAVIVCRLGAKLNLEVTNLGLGVLSIFLSPSSRVPENLSRSGILGLDSHSSYIVRSFSARVTGVIFSYSGKSISRLYINPIHEN